MTEAIVSAVVKKLADLLLKEVRSQRGFDNKVDEVKIQLSQMECFLKDADSIKKKGDERIRGWVRSVRSVAYETEDAIDTFHVEVNYRWLGLIPKGRVARHTLIGKISKIQAKLVRISEARTTFGIHDLGKDVGRSESQTPPSFKRRMLPDVDNTEVVGFEAEKRDIIKLLSHGPSDQSRRVVTIVGPGGIGKTTLAHKVYTSSTVRSHFDSCLWITVSQNFNLLDVLKTIHQKLTNDKELKGETQEDQIQFLLGEVNALLKNKNYLIVLDDVWREEVFTQLKPALVNVGNGIKVLMTSRSRDVANYGDPSGVYDLQLLNEEESLVLFLKKALRSSELSPKCPEELLDLATELVKKCYGLPLALIVLGGLLSTKPRTYHEWSRVLEKLNWYEIERGECMHIIATSYDDLPYFHKSCFRYLACFPEDYKIPAEPLLKMWIAEGLIEDKEEGQLEDYAEDYLEELAQRCLVQVVERFLNGAIKSIRVHDLLRQVALSEATENDVLLIWKEENAEKDVSMTRRVAFHEGNIANSRIYNRKDLKKINMPKLRTCLNFDQHNVLDIGFCLLRVLELRNTLSFIDLPSDLKNLIQLKYLGLRWTGVTVIPTWIGHLHNLQTFDIKGTRIMELPEIFWKITNLRHVHYSSSFGSGISLLGPPSTANLVKLRSLGRFHVPKSWKASLPRLLGIRKLQLICHDKNDSMLIHDLISKLENLHSVRLENFYPPEDMIDLSMSPSYQNIHTMYLSGYDELGITQTVKIAEIPPNLTKLKLYSFRLDNEPMQTLEKLRSLKSLELNRIMLGTDCTFVCTDGGFPQLQSLKLDTIRARFKWEVHYGALPVLKYLLISSCYFLDTLPDLRHMTTLQELRINGEVLSEIQNKSEEEWLKFATSNRLYRNR